MWTYPEDRTAGVITAAAQRLSEHGDAGCPKLPETAVLFYMHSGPAYLQRTRPCRLPLVPLSDDHAEQVRRELQNAGLL